MVDSLVSEESRLYIFKKPILCHICSHDIFLPIETFTDVEKPGIQVTFVHNTAICQQCGFVIQFGDPSYYDNENDIYRWALDQQFINEQPTTEAREPFIDADTIAKYERCIYLSLQILIKHDESPQTMLNLYDNAEYLAIANYFDASYEQTYSQLITRDCLGLLLRKLMDKNIADSGELIKVLQHDDNMHLESFLKALIMK
ncbi:hypothetical protein [Solibacillus sp. FSL W8-0372]|uniref:hypothetical protein n=1 Tax=Solibacillus sp. FSL W8-0372 TaxID=2921713 RepID=UPI0030CD7BCA